MSLKLRVYLFFILLLLASMLASLGVLISNARQAVQSEVENTMQTAAHLITVSISGGSLSRELGINEHMNELVKALSEMRSLHILMFDRQGLLFEGRPQAAPESLPPEWFVKVLFPDVQPLSRRFGTGHMVIYAAPVQQISERWQDIRALLALGLLILIVVGVFIYWGVEWLLRPLLRLVDGLSEFERGDFHVRLPRFSLREMDQLSQTFNRMGEALEQSSSENQRLATLVRQSGDAILSLDHAGYVTFCNARAEQLFAEQTPVLKGESLGALSFTENRQLIGGILQNCQAVENLETGLSKGDGETISLLMSTVPLHNNDGCVSGVICSLRDITELKQAETARNQLRETRLLTKHMDEAQEAERRHLARELHDELGQCLTAIKTDAVLIRNRSEQTDARVYGSAQAIIDTASHIYDVVHNMITRLRPSPLDDLGLVATLQECISNWRQRQADINFSLEVSGDLSRLNEKMNITVFRVVQEAITNAVRHAEANSIRVQVINRPAEPETAAQAQLEIIIADDGKGMEVQDFHSDVDFGLLGMRERAQSLGGQFRLDSQLGAGVTIHITLPLTADVLL